MHGMAAPGPTQLANVSPFPGRTPKYLPEPQASTTAAGRATEALARSIKSSTPTPSRAPSLPMDRAHAQRRRGSHARFPFQRETRRQKRREAVDRGPTKPPPPGPACHALACTPSLGERAVGKGQIPSVTPAASVAPCGVPPCVHPKRPPRTLADLTLLRTTRGTHWQRQ
jgi:hypothetical protein